MTAFGAERSPALAVNGLRGPSQLTAAQTPPEWKAIAAAAPQVSGLNYAAAAQGIRRFWRRAEDGTEPEAFIRRLQAKLSILNV